MANAEVTKAEPEVPASAKVADWIPDLETMLCGEKEKDVIDVKNLDTKSTYSFQNQYKYSGPLFCYDVDLWRSAKADGGVFKHETVEA